uniref:Protein sleepless n=1 Tax=Mesocestoides corti TaxID=53468 RepID=A0A5K3EWK0_MESCO
MNGRRVALIAVLFLVAAATVGALKCYQCESHTQDGCYPLDTRLIQPTDCGPEAKSCTTLRQDAEFKIIINNQTEPRVRYVRGCSVEPSKSSVYCIERAGTGSHTKNRFCTCDSDGCNPARRSVEVGFFVLAIVLPLTHALL